MLIGIVGKPSAGKSTFFKSITMADVATAPYPFTTIQPNEGVGFVRVPCVDKELNTQCNPREGYCVNHVRFVPIKLLDVAGLVPDAHLGKGLGLQFLDDLRTADVLIHVVDISGSANERGEIGEPGCHDPAKDVKFLEFEIDMWVLSILKKGWERFVRQLKQEKGKVTVAIAKQVSGLNITENDVKDALGKMTVHEDPINWTDEQLFELAHRLRVMTKPIIIAANKCDLPTAKANLERLRQEFPNHVIVPCSSESELALKEAAKHNLITYTAGETSFEVKGTLTPGQEKAIEFIKQNVIIPFAGTGVQKVLDTAVWEMLGVIAIFPGGVGKLGDQYGNILPDCFLLRKGSTALDFANRVHSDLAKNFIRAIDVHTKRVIGKDHVLKHRDVVEIIAGK